MILRVAMRNKDSIKGLIKAVLTMSGRRSEKLVQTFCFDCSGKGPHSADMKHDAFNALVAI